MGWNNREGSRKAVKGAFDTAVRKVMGSETAEEMCEALKAYETWAHAYGQRSLEVDAVLRNLSSLSPFNLVFTPRRKA